MSSYQQQRWLWLVVGCLCFSQWTVSSVKAQTTETTDEMLARISAIEMELEQLRIETASVPYAPPASSAPKYPTVALTGFFQADAAFFSQDAVSIASVGDIQDGADFRRARLAAKGQAYENVGYFVEFDFGFPGRPSFMDVYLQLQNTAVGSIAFGQLRTPFGMDGLTSVKDLLFVERALPFAFLPFRQIGIHQHAAAEDGSGTFSLSGFRFPTGPYGGNVGDAGGYGMASRLTWLPYWVSDDSRLVHFGVAYSYLNPSSNQVQYRNQPEVFVAETGGAAILPPNALPQVPFFVDTNPISARTAQLVGLEHAIQFNSFYFQTEAMWARVLPYNAAANDFFGAYAQASYVLTGERHSYNHDQGVFGRVKPRCPFGNCTGWGAWEIAARWSYLDLNSGTVLGGRLNDITLGLNWYLNNNTKFQFNYIHAMLDNPTFGDSDTDIALFRPQVDF